MPSYKLRYFDFTGRGEPIRILLSYGGIPFEDERVSKTDWVKIKPTIPLGQLPVLVIDGETFGQTTALCRHAGNVAGLAGVDHKENLQIDTTAETINDLLGVAYGVGLSDTKEARESNAEKMKSLLPLVLGILEGQVKKYGHIASKNLSWADILFLTATEDLANMLNRTNVLDNYPNLQKLKKTVLSLAGVRKWIQKRPVLGLFYDLKSEL